MIFSLKKVLFSCFISLLLFISGILSLFLYNRAQIENIFLAYPFSEVVYSYPWGKSTVIGKDILKGQKTKGQFIASANRLGAIGIKFNTHNKINYDLISFRIKEKGKKDWYYQQTSRTDQIRQDVFWPFGFSPISNSEGKIYEFEIESYEGVTGDAVAVTNSQKIFIASYTYPKQFLLDKKQDIPYFVGKKIASVFTTELSFTLLTLGIISLFAPLPFRMVKKRLSQKVL